ncbi:uncharacterized protein LOC124279867 [Haliotis rubra]|uniref:uncharacterized protein LOC124279867 n=1 Tax=Haliotis rubra TaxID=36100 RepID=UPI001EE587F0|nr:uncharacterized protein LOC124279867 [Haliotis rubra]
MVDVLRLFSALSLCLIAGTQGNCPDGKYGDQCDECHCPPKECDPVSGCTGTVCDSGWSGPKCQIQSVLLISAVVAGGAYLLLIFAVTAAAAVWW